MRARIRTIKPEAHTDEELWDAEVSSGLPLFRGFLGLWNHADREGRFEWRPRPLKAGILPYWAGDFADVLEALEKAGFIVRYEVDGKEYGVIPSFTRHQTINAREEASKLPPPPVDDACPARAPRVTCAHMGKGREGKGREDRVACASQEDPPPVSIVTPTRGGERTVRQVAEEALDARRSGEWALDQLPRLRPQLEVMWDGWRAFNAKPGMPFPSQRSTLLPLVGMLADGRNADEIAGLLRDAHPLNWHRANRASLEAVCKNVDGLSSPASSLRPKVVEEPQTIRAKGGL